MDTLPLITVAVPTKNRRRFIPELLRGFLAQDYPNKELIVVEDGDESCEDLCAAAGVRYYRRAGSTGVKLNFIHGVARGEYVARFDDDDVQMSDRLTAQMAFARLSRKAVTGLSSELFYREGDGRAWEYHGDSWWCLGNSLFYRLDWALAHPCIDACLGEDTTFSNDAHAAGQYAGMCGVNIVVARTHDSNTSNRTKAGEDPGKIYIGDTFLGYSDNWREVPLETLQAVIGR